MNLAHIHLLLNHFPVVGVFFAFITFLTALAKRNEEVKKTAYILFILVGIFSIPTYFTGEGAEEVIEHLPGISEHLIEEHEEFALIAFLITLSVSGIALAGIFMPQFKNGVTLAILIFGLVNCGVLAYTAKLGGVIHHPEIRDNADKFLEKMSTHKEAEEYERREHEKHQ